MFKVVFVDHGVCTMVCTSDDTGQGSDPSVRTFKGGDVRSSLIHWKSLFHLCKTETIIGSAVNLIVLKTLPHGLSTMYANICTTKSTTPNLHNILAFLNVCQLYKIGHAKNMTTLKSCAVFIMKDFKVMYITAPV